MRIGLPDRLPGLGLSQQDTHQTRRTRWIENGLSQGCIAKDVLRLRYLSLSTQGLHQGSQRGFGESLIQHVTTAKYSQGTCVIKGNIVLVVVVVGPQFRKPILGLPDLRLGFGRMRLGPLVGLLPEPLSNVDRYKIGLWREKLLHKLLTCGTLRVGYKGIVKVGGQRRRRRVLGRATSHHGGGSCRRTQ